METDSSYQVISVLLDDKQFSEWIIKPTPELDAHWEERMDKDEDLKKNVMALKGILEKIKVVEPSLTPEDKRLVWQQIEKKILAQERKKNRFRGFWTTMAAAAAVVVFMAGGYWLLSNNNRYINDTDYSLFAEMDGQLMKSKNINLILSGNRKIDIDKDDEVITYSHKGEIKVGREQVAREAETPQLNQLIVPYGKTTSLILSDGTKVWVNSGSKLIYPVVFEKNKREIFLTGEAYFDVTKNKKAPFIIKTNHIDVNVLGTKLNVSAYSDDSHQSIVLVTGAVEVKSKELKGPFKIMPNEKLAYGVATKKVDVQKVDVNHHISWVNGYLWLQSEELGNLLHKIERYYNQTFIYNSEELKDTYVSGKLNLEVNLKEVLDNISITTPIAYIIEEDGIAVTLQKEKS